MKDRKGKNGEKAVKMTRGIFEKKFLLLIAKKNSIGM